MKSRLRFIGLLFLLLAFSIFFSFLYFNFRVQNGKIAILRQQLAELSQIRTQNQALQKVLWQSEELEELHKDNAELFRIRNEIRRLRDAAEKKLDSEQNLEEQLQTENANLRFEKQQLEQAPEIVSASQTVDANELMQIGQAFSLYAKMNDNKIPEDFTELKSYTTADIFPTLETDRYEILYKGKLTDIADPANTPLLRAKLKNSQNQRPYFFVDGHLETIQE